MAKTLDEKIKEAKCIAEWSRLNRLRQKQDKLNKKPS